MNQAYFSTDFTQLFFGVNLQFISTILTIFFLSKFSSLLSIPHWWLSGLEFCSPKYEDFRKNISTFTPKIHSNKKKKTINIKEALKMHIYSSQISKDNNYLYNHRFYHQFEVIVQGFVLVIVIILFTESANCFHQLINYSHDYSVKNDKESNNISILLLIGAILYCLKSLFSMITQAGIESYEMKLSLILGILSSIFCFFILKLPETIINFGINDGFQEFVEIMDEFIYILENSFRLTTLSRIIKFSLGNITSFKVFLAIFGGFIGSISVFPGLRLAKCHLLLQNNPESSYFALFISTCSFIFHCQIILAWINPFASVVLNLLSKNSYFESMLIRDFQEEWKFWLLTILCTMRIYLLRPYLQCFLSTYIYWIERFINDKKKDGLEYLYNKVVGIYYHACVVCVQLIAPTVLLFFFALAMRSKGELEVGLCNAILPIISPQAILQWQLKNLFISSIFSFMCWWFTFCWFTMSIFGIIFEKVIHHHHK